MCMYFRELMTLFRMLLLLGFFFLICLPFLLDFYSNFNHENVNIRFFENNNNYCMSTIYFFLINISQGANFYNSLRCIDDTL